MFLPGVLFVKGVMVTLSVVKLHSYKPATLILNITDTCTIIGSIALSTVRIK